MKQTPKMVMHRLRSDESHRHRRHHLNFILATAWTIELQRLDLSATHQSIRTVQLDRLLR